MLSNTAKLSLGILATQFAPTSAWWGMGGSTVTEEVVAEAIEEPSVAELLEEEPMLDIELLQEAEKIPEINKTL